MSRGRAQQEHRCCFSSTFLIMVLWERVLFARKCLLRERREMKRHCNAMTFLRYLPWHWLSVTQQLQRCWAMLAEAWNFPWKLEHIAMLWLFYFFSIIFNWKTTWAVEISCEMKILSDFTLIASEHPIEDICFSMPTIVPRSQCFNSKILMGLVRRSSKQKFRRSFREKIKPFLFSKMVVFCNFPSKKKVKKKSLAITFLRWISIFCWKTSTITSPFPVMPTKRRSASAYMFAGAVPRTYHYSSKLFYLLSEYK